MSKSWKIHTQTSIITWIEEKIIFFLSTCNSALKFHSRTVNNYPINSAAIYGHYKNIFQIVQKWVSLSATKRWPINEQFEKGEDGYFINFIPNLL